MTVVGWLPVCDADMDRCQQAASPLWSVDFHTGRLVVNRQDDRFVCTFIDRDLRTDYTTDSVADLRIWVVHSLRLLDQRSL